jgi:hypothetical protein
LVSSNIASEKYNKYGLLSSKIENTSTKFEININNTWMGSRILRYLLNHISQLLLRIHIVLGREISRQQSLNKKKGEGEGRINDKSVNTQYINFSSCNIKKKITRNALCNIKSG